MEIILATIGPVAFAVVVINSIYAARYISWRYGLLKAEFRLAKPQEEALIGIYIQTSLTPSCDKSQLWYCRTPVTFEVFVAPGRCHAGLMDGLRHFGQTNPIMLSSSPHNKSLRCSYATGVKKVIIKISSQSFPASMTCDC